MLRKVVVSFLLAAAFVSGCTDKGERSSETVAANFTLQNTEGKKVTLVDFKGKVVLLDFWATWCPPCRESIPGIEKLYKTYSDKGLVILAISLDEGGPDALKSFISEHGITYPVLKGTEDVAVNYKVRTIPMLVIVDKQGTIVKRYLGLGSEDEIEKEIKSLL